jgi:hypothetical protein
MKKLVERIDQRYRGIRTLSMGDRCLIDENIKLIKYAFKYLIEPTGEEYSITTTGLRKKKDKTIDEGKFLNLRGKMLVNPVARVIYYDYLGLEHFRVARKLICDTVNIEPHEPRVQEFLQVNMDRIKTHPFAKDEFKIIKFHLKESLECFSKAGEFSENDILWSGYVKGNICRVMLIDSLIDQATNRRSFEKCKKPFLEAITSRENILIEFSKGLYPVELDGRYSDDASGNLSFLNAHLHRECYYIQAIYFSFKTFCGRKLDEGDEESISRIEGYLQRFNDISMFNDTNELLNSVKSSCYAGI